MIRFDGRVVLVTGAASGLGAEYSRYLATRGASVVLADVDDRVREVASELGAAASVGDLSAAEAAERAVRLAVDTHGQLDGVVCNAGLAAAAGPVHRFDEASFERVLRSHLHHTLLVCRAAWPQLREADAASIVTTSSATALGLAGTSDYAAAKGAIWSTTRSMALDGARHQIRVNTVMPMAYTPMAAGFPDEDVRQWMRAAFDTVEVAPAVAWLLHPACSTTGECFTVGAGRVGRVVIATAPGWQSVDPLTLETVAEQWERVCSLDGMTVAASSGDDARHFARALAAPSNGEGA